MADDTLRRIDALIGVGMRLSRSAPSGRIVLAKLARSIDPAWIAQPSRDAILAELESASAAALEPIEWRRVERVLRDAWGVAPGKELDDLERDPVAVTPIAQVHRGELDGAPVAVKVLRPGIAASVRQDLSLLEGLLAPLRAAFPAVDAAAILREVRERALDELDLETEADAQRRFHRALRSHRMLSVPAPVTRLAHENVLVSEWVDGVPLSDADDPDAAAAALVLFALGAARSGVIHADLAPDDVLVLDGGRLAILDFGQTRAVDTERVRAAADALEGFAADDSERFGQALASLGWLTSEHADTAADLLRHALGELSRPEPVRLDSDAVSAAAGRLAERPAAIAELVRAGSLQPEDLWPARGLGLLFSTIARVGATGSWIELARAALRDGWDAELSSCGR